MAIKNCKNCGQLVFHERANTQVSRNQSTENALAALLASIFYFMWELIVGHTAANMNKNYCGEQCVVQHTGHTKKELYKIGLRGMPKRLLITFAIIAVLFGILAIIGYK